MKPLVIYHGNCPDGFTAAWVAACAIGDVELYAGEYGKPAPFDLATNRNVFVVDFSYPREQLEQLYFTADTLVVLDHHKTAQAALEGLPYCTFDMDRSGAGITWDYFNPGEPRPWLVDYVEDRDLWRFKLPRSEEVSLFVRTAPHTLEAWDGMARTELIHVLASAEGCKRYLDHYVRDALRQAYLVGIDWAPVQEPIPEGWQRHMAVAVNVSYTGVSDVLNAALEANPKVPMALGWHRAADGSFNCSLRSDKGFDCSEVAKHFGGGGHAQASGFRLKLDHPLAQQLLSAGVGSDLVATGNRGA